MPKPKKVESISKLRLSSSSVKDDPEPQSLFIAVDYPDNQAPYFGSIFQIEINVNNHEFTFNSTPTAKGCPQIKRSLLRSSIGTQLTRKEYVAHFRQPKGYRSESWTFSPASSKEDLYMLPFGTFGYKDNPLTDAPWHGCVFNLRTKMHKPIKPPPSDLKHLGPVVTVRGHIYCMSHPTKYYKCAPESFFVCYNPDDDLWETLEPFPTSRLGPSPGYFFHGYIMGVAVWHDNILFNMESREIWAYDLNENKWYPVTVDDHECFNFWGRAVAVGNTIYALTNYVSDSVLALSVERVLGDDDLVFKCSLHSSINVPGMTQILYPRVKGPAFRSRHLVHLGKDKYCFVYNAMFNGVLKYQPIQFTIIKLDGENSIVIDKCFHNFEIADHEQFSVEVCFSLPQYKTTAFEKGKRLAFDFAFDLNSFPEDYVSKQKFQEDDPFVDVVAELIGKSNVASKVSTISAVTGHPSHGYAKPSFAPKASTLASERSNTDEKGHSIYVRKLAPGVTVRQVENGLKKFGAIERDGIQVRKNKMGKCFAFVKFESETSKKRAIEASTIIIEGCLAEILEKPRTAIGGESSSSSFGMNKLKKHREEDSRSKEKTSSSGGHN